MSPMSPECKKLIDTTTALYSKKSQNSLNPVKPPAPKKHDSKDLGLPFPSDGGLKKTNKDNRVLSTGFRVLSTGFRVLSTGFRVLHKVGTLQLFILEKECKQKPTTGAQCCTLRKGCAQVI